MLYRWYLSALPTNFLKRQGGSVRNMYFKRGKIYLENLHANEFSRESIVNLEPSLSSPEIMNERTVTNPEMPDELSPDTKKPLAEESIRSMISSLRLKDVSVVRVIECTTPDHTQMLCAGAEIHRSIIHLSTNDQANALKRVSG